MKREFSPKQIMQMILVCVLLVAVVYIFYRADHAELSQLNGPVTASQGAAPYENESDPALRSFTYLLDKGESTEYYLNYEDNPVMRYIANYKTFEASDGTQQRVLMSFQVPPAGKEADNLSLLVSTQSYPDVMSMTYFGGSLAELYEAGNILDLGPYIDQYMPNYKAWLEANPQVIATTPVGDQDLHLTLTGIRANLSAYDLFAGWCYRRDWIVRYGVQPDMLFDPMADSEPRPNPKAGQAFSGHYTLDKDGNAIESATLEENVNGDSWVDDVIFPSGNTDPIYISDWEWMFEIFERALKEQGIADGYVTSVYYPGFNQNGDLVSSFGGGSPWLWYDAEHNEVKFGGDSDTFKTYLACMNAWWNRGWIDKQFAERSGDMYYKIDDVTVRSGKVGFWQGSVSTLGSRISNAALPYTEGAVVFGAANPINDVYGGPEQQLKIPDTFFGTAKYGGSVVVTDKAKEKDLALLFHWLDYFYTEEGAMLNNYGLSAEQQAQLQDATYLRFGVDAAYTLVERDGQQMVRFHDLLKVNDGNIRTAMNGSRVMGLGSPMLVDYGDTDTYVQHCIGQWDLYKPTGFMALYPFNHQLPVNAVQSNNKVYSRIVNEYMYVQVPQFITGKKNLESDWDTYCADLKKRGYQKVLKSFNELLQESDAE